MSKWRRLPPGALTFGAGYSSLDKVIGTASISDRNLFGLGYSAALRFALGRLSKNLRFSFTDPYFLGTRYSAGTDLYYETRTFSTYRIKSTGADIRSGKELAPGIRADLLYKLETVRVYDIAEEASFFVISQVGKKLTSAIGLTFTRDTRDDYFIPTRGSKLSLSFTDCRRSFGRRTTDFLKRSVFGQLVLPLPLKTVFNFRAQVGMVHCLRRKGSTDLRKIFCWGPDDRAGL